ncbi:MAG: ABC transporter substrate-binding protein, partial [Cyanobacteria bacterium P01_A01_bin.3]
MKRRKILGYAATATGLAVEAAACGENSTTPTSAQSDAESPAFPSITWRMATSWPQSLDTIYGGAQT